MDRDGVAMAGSAGTFAYAADVGAVVLSLGESYTERARASLARQTLLPTDVVTVTSEIRPFHRAINAAAESVSP